MFAPFIRLLLTSLGNVYSGKTIRLACGIAG
jgi:hypothetical protein